MIVGIDLGTTHSLIGTYSEHGPRLFPNALGDVLTPSVVSVDGDTILVGQAARDRLVSHPQHTVAAFKRWMGTNRETFLGKRAFRPEELSALVLRSLVADAEAALGERVTDAVISVPAYFSDAQRKATRAAGELAGLRVERLVNEPTAAALAYGLQQRDRESRFLVFDLGGGTFDVSILEMFEGVVEVHASAGDNYLGGEDFLGVLLQAFFDDQGVKVSALEAMELARVSRALELAKRTLSGASEASVDVQLGGKPVQWTIDEARFLRLCEPLVQRMRAPLERAMRDAKLSPSQLDEILLVGGASRMPMVAKMVSRMFGRLPLRHIDPDQAIALGATVAAGLKARDARLEEVILTDVCPYTLGTEVARQSEDGTYQAGFFQPIIERNSTVPVSREDQFFPIQDHQKVLALPVFQGENPMVANNVRLGEIQVKLDPRRPKHENGVTVRFTYDVDGLLQVEVTEHATGKRHELVLEQNPGLLSAAEIRERLAKLEGLKIHPREHQENLAVLARAERLYEEYLGARATLAQWIAAFRAALDSQDTARIDHDRKAFSAGLDEIEANA
ncbi:molecular chaperone HscC [Lysobacter helvus]|uniref:Molecular chaperone HscC n=2 Tax=Lysobacteraceae TaxID=32033 RepID=A0ABN6FS31_9GAMM|nr:MULTISPECIES: molecular chaperone HscC [Lysobacter]BCT92281.1 molecular chaperone HscC [Lysobacter caseinilyticus]BCT95434.1 molecular chaperone HscC [Lysobacter helvus]